jgi:MFS family permease
LCDCALFCTYTITTFAIMSTDPEKSGLDAYHVESEQGDSRPSATEEIVLTPEEQKKTIWRIDRRLVTTVGILYCVSLMDRTNISAASIAGMDLELKLVGNMYNVATVVFFTTYIVFQPPSTVLVRAIGPRIHLSAITTLWGIVLIGMGFVKDFGGLAACRVLLGLLEAGFFPSCVYLLSTWYTRYEVGKRYSFFYILGCVASACSGILAFGLMQLNGRAGLTGWRWIYVIEGILTALLGIAGYWLLVDFPDSTRKSWSFIDERQRAWVVQRVNADRGDVKITAFSWSKFLGAGADLKIWYVSFLSCLSCFGRHSSAIQPQTLRLCGRL